MGERILRSTSVADNHVSNTTDDKATAACSCITHARYCVQESAYCFGLVVYSQDRFIADSDPDKNTRSHLLKLIKSIESSRGQRTMQMLTHQYL